MSVERGLKLLDDLARQIDAAEQRIHRVIAVTPERELLLTRGLSLTTIAYRV
jgi:hypothetical protein